MKITNRYGDNNQFKAPPPPRGNSGGGGGDRNTQQWKGGNNKNNNSQWGAGNSSQGKLFSSMASKPINIRWIRNGSLPY